MNTQHLIQKFLGSMLTHLIGFVLFQTWVQHLGIYIKHFLLFSDVTLSRLNTTPPPLLKIYCGYQTYNNHSCYFLIYISPLGKPTISGGIHHTACPICFAKVIIFSHTLSKNTIEIAANSPCLWASFHPPNPSFSCIRKVRKFY